MFDEQWGIKKEEVRNRGGSGRREGERRGRKESRKKTGKKKGRKGQENRQKGLGKKRGTDMLFSNGSEF